MSKRKRSSSLEKRSITVTGLIIGSRGDDDGGAYVDMRESPERIFWTLAIREGYKIGQRVKYTIIVE